jgi:HPt (histidine-containing phosphotransfer) domain-containing protein
VEQIVFNAHTIRGIAANLRLEKVYALTGSIEQAAEKSTPIDYLENAKELRTAMALTATKIHDYLSSLHTK